MGEILEGQLKALEGVERAVHGVIEGLDEIQEMLNEAERRSKEKCKNCKHVGEIYFPPTKYRDSIHLKGCFYFADGHDGGKQVMYLDTLESLCECFEEKGGGTDG